MNLSYTYDDQRGIFVATPTGVLTDDEVWSAFSTLTQHPNFGPDVRIFHDFSRVSEYRLSAALLDRIAEVMVRQTVAARRAFLVGTAKGYGTATFYLRSVASDKIEVFYDRAKALDWLNEGAPAERRVA